MYYLISPSLSPPPTQSFTRDRLNVMGILPIAAARCAVSIVDVDATSKGGAGILGILIVVSSMSTVATFMRITFIGTRREVMISEGFCTLYMCSRLMGQSSISKSGR